MRLLAGIGIALGMMAVCGMLVKTGQLLQTDSVLTMCVPEITESGEVITLPYSPENTDMILQALTTYEGPFLEDGSNEEVSDVAALVVYNPLDSVLAQVSISLTTEDEKLLFQGAWLPPKSQCLLLEADKKKYKYEDILDCCAQQYRSDAENLLGDGLILREDTEDTFSLENKTERETGKLLIHYKTYLEQTDTYIGGITRQLQVDSILPGQILSFSPPYYVRGYVKVFLVTEQAE